MSDLTKYAKGKRMVREDKIKKLETLNQVKANPTLEGEEETLESLKIGNKKYALGGGTEVIANPELAGTEDDLEGLQVGENKYKVGIKLYKHNIKMIHGTLGIMFCSIINRTPNTFDFNSLINYLSEKKFEFESKIYPVNGSSISYKLKRITIENVVGVITPNPTTLKFYYKSVVIAVDDNLAITSIDASNDNLYYTAVNNSSS
ncbi:MAG: hypothetical protein IKF82_07430, partial [Bacilli bacterium]|nr:hypothetical protein [Bacilli bacterium]